MKIQNVQTLAQDGILVPMELDILSIERFGRLENNDITVTISTGRTYIIRDFDGSVWNELMQKIPGRLIL